MHRFYFLRQAVLAVAILFYVIPAKAQPDTLTVKIRKPWYETTAFRFAAAPAVLIGLGISEINNGGIYSSYRVRRDLQSEFPHVRTRVDDVFPSMPMVLAGGLYLSGVKSRNHPLHATVMFFAANALGGWAGHHLKRETAIERPDASDFLAFPSKHTIAAFVAAECLHQEYGHKSAWISIAGYTMATTVGTIRMLENRHWLSDVLAGAGIGILSVRLTYIVYPWLVKQFAKRQPKGLIFSPTALYNKPGALIGYRF